MSSLVRIHLRARVLELSLQQLGLPLANRGPLLLAELARGLGMSLELLELLQARLVLIMELLVLLLYLI